MFEEGPALGGGAELLEGVFQRRWLECGGLFVNQIDGVEAEGAGAAGGGDLFDGLADVIGRLRQFAAVDRGVAVLAKRAPLPRLPSRYLPSPGLSWWPALLGLLPCLLHPIAGRR